VHLGRALLECVCLGLYTTIEARENHHTHTQSTYFPLPFPLARLCARFTAHPPC
jgi:hypothetical protein